MNSVLLAIAQSVPERWPVFLVGMSLIVVTAAYALRQHWTGFGPMIVWKIAERLGLQAIHNAYLPYTGGVKMIDHIVLAGDTVVLIQLAPLSGKVTGQSHDATWLSEQAGSSFRIPNPLRQNYPLVQAIQERVGSDVDVVGVITFVGDAKFSKGLPDGVYAPRALRQYLRDLARRRTGLTDTRWKAFAGSLARGDQPADLVRQQRGLRAPGCPTAIKLRHQGL